MLKKNKKKKVWEKDKKVNLVSGKVENQQKKSSIWKIPSKPQNLKTHQNPFSSK